MTYHVFARKWRPQTFETTVGQQHVLKALSHSLDQERLHHAYLFTGTRGVGKTTIARIFAKALNCEAGVSSHPCGQCSACKEIEAGRFVDLIEVDAASRTKVEDTRELLDNVQYAPTRGRYKIYLIDEVHMLSTHSFNALLKTLEEPPTHVKFLLATTDPQKLPVTILSRCLQFHLKSLTLEQISQQLSQILTEENIPFEAAALPPLARAANGSVRDALSILEQAVAYCSGRLTLTGVSELLGTVDQNTLAPLLEAIADQNAVSIFEQAREIDEKSQDVAHVLDAMATAFYQASLMQVAPTSTPNSHPLYETLQALSRKLNKTEIQLFYQMTIMGKRDLPYAPDARTGFEMTLLRMLAFRPIETNLTVTPAATEQKKIVPSPAPEAPSKSFTPTTEQSIATTPKLSTETWASIVRQLPINGMVKLLASNCCFEEIKDHDLHLTISAEHSSLVNDRAKDRLTEALNTFLKASWRLHIAVAGKTSDSSPLQHSPMQQALHEEKEKQRSAFEALQADSGIQELINAFDATLTVDAVKASD